MGVTKPYNFTRFGAMDVTKPYKSAGFGAMEVTQRFIGGDPPQVWVFYVFVCPGPGGSGSSREAPQSPPWAFPGPPGGLPEVSGTSDKRKQKT